MHWTLSFFWCFGRRRWRQRPKRCPKESGMECQRGLVFFLTLVGRNRDVPFASRSDHCDSAARFAGPRRRRVITRAPLGSIPLLRGILPSLWRLQWWWCFLVGSGSSTSALEERADTCGLAVVSWWALALPLPRWRNARTHADWQS